MHSQVAASADTTDQAKAAARQAASRAKRRPQSAASPQSPRLQSPREAAAAEQPLANFLATRTTMLASQPPIEEPQLSPRLLPFRPEPRASPRADEARQRPEQEPMLISTKLAAAQAGGRSSRVAVTTEPPPSGARTR